MAGGFGQQEGGGRALLAIQSANRSAAACVQTIRFPQRASLEESQVEGKNMTRYDELLTAGRALTIEERDAALHLLTTRPEFPALLAAVRDRWEDFCREASAREVVGIHGRVEHCNGSAFGVEAVESILRRWANEDPKRLRAKPRQRE